MGDNKVNLPAVTPTTTPVLRDLADALGVPRDLLASEEEIEAAWSGLPRILRKIPPELRTAGIARMCVAVSTGLFDSAINYIWNCSVIELRQKIRNFGLNVVGQILRKDFDESALLDLKDAELLKLCLELNLITEDGFFFLDQCRDVRNNFSAAHPPVGTIDDTEFIAFLNRCAKYALTSDYELIGVDTQSFLAALKGGRFSTDQTEEWLQRLQGTHEAQRELLVGMLHGLYSDPASDEETRLNSLTLCQKIFEELTPSTKSKLVDQHAEYLAKGDKKRHSASQQFFEKLGALSLLSETERHSLVTNACKKLFSIHQGLDNFYNEPPFAERLLQISTQGAIPDTAKTEYVTTVVTCAVGNPYGTSRAALPDYKKMIQGFSPKEVDIMLKLPTTKTVVGQRIARHKRCKDMFIDLVRLIDPDSVPTSSEKSYTHWSK
jgi:hypothetical protein